jgi:hypothetical protein
MEPIGCPEKVVRNDHYALRNNQELRSTLLLYYSTTLGRKPEITQHID